MTATVRIRIPIPTAVLLSALICLGAMSVGTTSAQASTSSWTPSSYTSRLVTLVNQARAQHGLSGLSVASGTSSVAASWTSHLAAQRSLSHNPHLVSDVQHHGSAAANAVAENVGNASPNDPDSLFAAYMNSPEHRTNILDREMRYLGISVAFAANNAWNTMDFVDAYGSSAASRPVSTTTHRTTHVHHASPSHSQVVVKKHSAPSPHKVTPPRPRTVQAANARVATPTISTPVLVHPETAELAASRSTASRALVIPGLAFVLLLGLVAGHVRVRRLITAG
jgi:uncharacterized protein YkwD